MDERSEQTHDLVRRNRVTITAVVATYNEEAYIGNCLTGLLAQQCPDADIEILVVDGTSTDRTVDIVRSFPEFGSKIRLLFNPRRLQVYAWNEALREARGEYFAMILAHAEYAPTYFAECLEVMRRKGADAVGGVQRPIGCGIVGRAVAFCMASSFGVGNARFRYTNAEEESDTVFSIFTRCETLRSLGGYDERVPFDEDSDLNYRLHRRGGKLVVSPRIHVRYYVRESLRGLWKQMYRYGYWRRFTQLKHPGKVPVRVFAPSILLAGVLLSAALAITPIRLGAALIPGLYALFLLMATLRAIPPAGTAAAGVPLVLATMHAAYGAGFWIALLSVRSLPAEAPHHSAAR
jgi:glycosyltransferase involved in cell wall biosynthesis